MANLLSINKCTDIETCSMNFTETTGESSNSSMEEQICCVKSFYGKRSLLKSSKCNMYEIMKKSNDQKNNNERFRWIRRVKFESNEVSEVYEYPAEYDDNNADTNRDDKDSSDFSPRSSSTCWMNKGYENNVGDELRFSDLVYPKPPRSSKISKGAVRFKLRSGPFGRYVTSKGKFKIHDGSSCSTKSDENRVSLLSENMLSIKLN